MAGPGSHGTEVIQVTNVSLSASSEQMRTLFGFLGKIEELRLFPPDGSPLQVSSRVCFVKFHEASSVVVAQYLTNTVFVDRALIVVPYAEGVIPDETKALSVMAPANAVVGLLPGGGLLRIPTLFTRFGALPLAALRAPSLRPALAAFRPAGANLNVWGVEVSQPLKLFSTIDHKVKLVAADLVPPSLKSDNSNTVIKEAMKNIQVQPVFSAVIKGDTKEESHLRSGSPAREKRTPSSFKQSQSRSKLQRSPPGPRWRYSLSREGDRISRDLSKTSAQKKKDKEKEHSKIPPKRDSGASRKRRQGSRSGSKSPKQASSQERKCSLSPSPRRLTKERKKDQGRRRNKREQLTTKGKDKGKSWERKSESDKDRKHYTRLA